MLVAPFGYLLFGYVVSVVWGGARNWFPGEYRLLPAGINFAVYICVYLVLVALLNRYTGIFADLLKVLRATCIARLT